MLLRYIVAAPFFLNYSNKGDYMKHIIDLLKGMVIGISNVIPGVSGGTMAVVMGIYDKIIFIKKNSFFVNIW